MSTIASANEQELVDALDKWFETTNRKKITLVTAGRSSVGKSILIGNMLNLKGDTAPEHQHGPSSTTKTVKLYTSTVGGVEVRIIDTPGLAATDVDEPKSLAALQVVTGGKADMLLYCISLLPDSIIDNDDQAIIKNLTLVFGKGIWEHAILVFTFANLVKMMPGKDIPQLVQAYAEKFQSVLQNVCPSFSVVSIFLCDQDQPQRPPTTIIALPAGLDPAEKLVEGMRWDESIYLEVLKKCSPKAIPAFLKARGPTPWIIRKALAIGQYVGATGITATFGGGAGAIAGTIVGGAIGGGIGLLAGGVGVGPGAVVGADIGATIAILGIGGVGALAGGMAGGMAAHSEIQEYETDQTKLEKVQEALQEEKVKKE